MLVDAQNLLAEYLETGATPEQKQRAQQMYDTRAHAIATTDETPGQYEVVPPSGSKLGFSNDDDKEKAIEREAVIMRKAKTKADLDTIWENCRRDFVDKHALTTEDVAQLEQLYRSRSRLVK